MRMTSLMSERRTTMNRGSAEIKKPNMKKLAKTVSLKTQAITILKKSGDRSRMMNP